MKKRAAFKAESCSLDGVYLVEASAGTGKTYSIQNLVVRLIVEKNLKIDEILIVTFTRAATAELIDRIRGIIQTSFNYLDLRFRGIKLDPEEENNFSNEKKLLTNYHQDFSDMEKIKESRKRLQNALLDFDSNAISTIHGFCQRMLKKNAFESGILFHTELADSDQILDQIQSLIRNQWRKICYDQENTKYIGLYRGLLPFDQSFDHSNSEEFDDYRLQSDDGGWGFSRAKCVAGYVPPGFYDFLGLVEKPEMQFDLTETAEPSVLAEEIFSVLDSLNQNIPDEPIPFLNDEEATVLPEELLSEQFEYAYGWIAFEQKLGQLNFDLWVSEYGEQVRPFSDKIRELMNLMLRFRTSLLNQVRKTTEAQLAALKQQDNFQTYDDLQKRMITALNMPGSTLAETLRNQFKAAIIDEFQDTDQGQYEIFSKVFAPGLAEGKEVKGTLFFVGDPKQAIYAFRGGDIFTYKGAVEDVGEARVLSLDTNYRSADTLVAAVNEIFGSHQFPFADPSIQFEKVKFCGNQQLRIDGNWDPTPFHYLSGGKNKRSAYESCVEKIYQLLTSNVEHFIKNPDKSSKINKIVVSIKPSDIAILCRKRTDFPVLADLLQKRGIPCVMNNDLNIFDTQEARDVEKLLLALQNPADIKLVTWLMQTSLLPERDCRSLCEMNLEESKKAVAETQEKLAELKVSFEQSGFPEMFRSFMEKFQIHQRYPGMLSGAQKYSNLIQIRDILTAEEKKGSKSSGMLTLWLQKQLSPETRTESGCNIILPTDVPAIQIMTIHNSKGLQFPVVFLPDLASSEISESRASKYHDPRENNKIYHRITDGEQTDLAVAESLQEELRIAYVALTRASCACYLLIPKKKNIFNAIHWLFTAKNISADTLPQHLRRTYLELKADPLEKCIGEENIETVELSNEVYKTSSGKELSFCPWGNTFIPAPVPKISYTSAHKYFRQSGKVSRSEEETTGELKVEQSQEKTLAEVFTLPRGDLFGTACHTIMEKWDYSKPENLEELISRYLAVVNIKEKINIAAEMFRKVVTAPIPQENGEPFTLQELTVYDRCAEMDFDFKLRENFNPAQIGAILNHHFRDRLEKNDLELLYAIRNQAGEETFYTGSADLIFRYNGKFYIADWKTDVLEKTLESFNPEHLFGVMWQKFYLYQSLLYSSALIRYLSLRLKKSPEQVYEEDFGGVRYLFLRGMDPAVPGRGIYVDKPDFELICKIAEVK